MKNKITYTILLGVMSIMLSPKIVSARTLIFDLESGTLYEEVEEVEEEISVPEITIYDLFSDEEIQLLFKTVETETFGADYESKKNVASVILNRVEQYGQTLKETITAPNQFCYGKNNISESTIKACEDALNNRGNVLGALFFRSDKRPETWNGKTFKYTDGNHNFY